MKDSASRKPLRLWPGVAIVALQFIALYVPGYFAPSTPAMVFGMIGSFTVGALLLFIWWLFFSRARWRDRLGGIALLIVVHAAAFFLADTSAKMVTVVPGIPWLCGIFVASLFPGRRAVTIVAVLVAISMVLSCTILPRKLRLAYCFIVGAGILITFSRSSWLLWVVGVTGLELNRADFYHKELSFQVSCSYGPGRYDPQCEEQRRD